MPNAYDVGNIVTEEIDGVTTDYYYYTRTNPANSSDCKIPWVSGGRIPVSSESEANRIVDQIIRYEKSPPIDPDYYRRMTFAAYFQDDSPQDGKANRAYMKTMEGVRGHMITQGFDVERVYVSNNPNPVLYKDGTSIPTEVKNSIVDSSTATSMLVTNTDDGQLIVGHRDHGSTNGWSEPPFRIGHLTSLTSHQPSIFFSINCLTGRFDADPSDSFAEAVLKTNGAAPSLIAATELSGTWRNDSLIKALFDGMWPGIIPTFPGTTASYPIKYNRLGDILNYAKSYLLMHHGATSGVKDHFEMYHLIGDPTIQLWADEPIIMRAKCKIWKNKLFIKTSSCPRGTVVTIWRKNKLLKRIEPSSNRIVIPLRDLKLSSILRRSPIYIRFPILICISAPGYRYTQIALSYNWISRLS